MTLRRLVEGPFPLRGETYAPDRHADGSPHPSAEPGAASATCEAWGPRCDECGRAGATTTARDGSGLLGRVCASCARLAEDERCYGGGDALGRLSG